MEKKAKAIIDRLQQSGYLAFFVGGYVRDRMIGRPTKDIDIATSATPDEVMKLFTHTVPTGVKHGTVTVIEEGVPFEVTTFRTESEYEKRRRPKRVEFVPDLESDLARRDFTINAMAMDRDGNLIDPFGGMDDIRRGRLRCVGDPEQRFREDALRMVRCIRFAAEYDLKVDEPTWNALLAQRDGLREIAMERVRMELERIVEGSHPEIGLALFVRADLPFYLKADLKVDKQRWVEATASDRLSVLSMLNDGDLRWAHLMLLLRLDADQAASLLKKLTFAGKRIKKITSLLAFQAELEKRFSSFAEISKETEHLAEKEWKTAAFHAGDETADGWLRWLPVLADEPVLSDHRLPPEVLRLLAEKGQTWLKERPIKEKRELNISGTDLLQLNQEKGAWIGRLLEQLALKVALGEIENDKALLLEEAKRMLSEQSGNGKDERGR
jgi:tRNA nucleotidyltransferase (CCA-adding enzyme)